MSGTMAGPDGSTLAQVTTTSPAPVSTPAAPVLSDPVVALATSAAPAEPTKAPDSLLTETPKAEDPKATEPVKEIKAEDYKLTLPDTLKADDPMLAAFLPAAAKSGLSNEAVQAVISAMAPEIQKIASAPYEAWNTLQTQWQNDVKSDPTIGGDKLPTTLARVNGAIRQFAGAETEKVYAALATTGAGNHPAILKMLNSMASALSEHGPVIGGTPRTEADIGSLMFPKSTGANRAA